MASTTSRSSVVAGRPPLGAPDLGLGSSGTNCSHCSPVRSVGWGFLLMPDTTNRSDLPIRGRFQNTLLLTAKVISGAQPSVPPVRSALITALSSPGPAVRRIRARCPRFSSAPAPPARPGGGSRRRTRGTGGGRSARRRAPSRTAGRRSGTRKGSTTRRRTARTYRPRQSAATSRSVFSAGGPISG